MGNNIYTFVISYRTYTQPQIPPPPLFRLRRQEYTLPTSIIENSNRTSKTYNFVKNPIHPELEPILEEDETATNISVDSNE